MVFLLKGCAEFHFWIKEQPVSIENLKMFGLFYLSINSNVPIIAIAFKILKGNDFVNDKIPPSAAEAHTTNRAVYNQRGEIAKWQTVF